MNEDMIAGECHIVLLDPIINEPLGDMSWEKSYTTLIFLQRILQRRCAYEERTILSKFQEVPLGNLVIRLRPAHLSYGTCRK